MANELKKTEDSTCPCAFELLEPCYRWDDKALHVCYCYDVANYGHPA